MKIILPKTYVYAEELDLSIPLFFLAGPIRGGADWQHCAVEQIGMLVKDFYAVLPNRYDESHPLVKYKMGGHEDTVGRQLTWERYYLNVASNIGCIIFWLPCEDKNFKRTGPEPYAMDTRGELGEWRGQMMNRSNIKIVVGAEEGFPGLSQIERNFNQALGCKFPIYKTLASTVRAAVKKIR